MANNNLLTFVNNASSSIQDAMGKPPKKKRVVNVRKFVQSRVKRLDNAAKPRATSRPKAPQLSNAIAQLLSRGSSCTWLGTSPVGMVPNVPAQAEREVATYACSTAAMPVSVCDIRSYSSPDLFHQQLPSCTQQVIDPELDSLLSSLASPVDPLSRHGSYESVYTSVVSSHASPAISNESQCYMPVSPYSDITDDLDSAYSSPIESARLSSNCSPTGFSTIVETASSLPTWTSPLQTTNASPVWQTAITDSCVQEISEWMSSDSTTTTTSVYDQGPPMTPTVSQLLEQYNQY